VPFLPTLYGLGTDVLTRPNSPYVTFNCPISAQTLVAAPAIRPEIAVIHVNVVDVRGNCVVYGNELLASSPVQAIGCLTD
jgi:glutaconate CoA-transferase, subunit A